MKVFNLTNSSLIFRGQNIGPGDSFDFKELDRFIPDHDKKLAVAKVISFGSLPKGWKKKPAIPQKKVEAAAKAAQPTQEVVVEEVSGELEAKAPEESKGKKNRWR